MRLCNFCEGPLFCCLALMRPSVSDGLVSTSGIMSALHQPEDVADFRFRCASSGRKSATLDEFIQQSDEHLYNSVSGVAHVMDRAEVRLINATKSHESLQKALLRLDLPNQKRLRPDWDQYFMQLAELAARRSNCMKRRVGCVLVRDRRVISTGYNGTPRHMKNCNEGGCESCFPFLRRPVRHSYQARKAPDATRVSRQGLAYQHACASTPKKTPCWKLVAKGSARDQYYTATRTARCI